MKYVEITVNGTAYPCTSTAGAMLRFKQQTGREINEIDPSSFSELFTYMWCCVVSGAKREGRSFDMSLMDFADAVCPEDFAAWRDAMTAEAEAKAEEPDGEKKSPSA